MKPFFENMLGYENILQKLLGYETKKAYSAANCLSLQKMEEWQIAGKVPIFNQHPLQTICNMSDDVQYK